MPALLVTACLLLAQPPGDVRFHQEAGRVEVRAALSPEQQAKLPTGAIEQEQGEQWLRLCLLGDDGTAGPPMLGTYERTAATLVFRPRFALEPGRRYRAFLGNATADYRVPAVANAEPPRVVKVYPTGDVLPANHLKFYVYFSRTMRGGQEMFKQIALLDEKGNEVLDPWLHDEIWDEDAHCLILYIHPGRIKWGVLLRELLGPALLPERRYTLVLRGTLRDAQGQPLGKDYTKSFRTTAEDRAAVDVAAWQVQAPAVGSREPLRVRFSKSLDHKSLGRFLSVSDAQGRRVEGTIEIGDGEKTWSLTPSQPWRDAAYTLAVDGRLEDVAGNTPLRPFDLDLNGPPPVPPRLRVAFRPK